MPTCQCGVAFTKTTNKRWCSQSCPALKQKRYETSRRWYLSSKAKPYDPNGVCPCGQPFVRRFGGKAQRYCSSQCRQRVLAKRWRHRNAERRHLLNRKHRLKRHNLAFEDYLDLYERQQAKCAICGGTDPGSTHGRKRRYFSVDHCHTTGKVRGLLCDKCNLGLGAFADKPERLYSAAQYLLAHHTPSEVA